MTTEVWIAIVGAVSSLVTGGLGHLNGARLANKKQDKEQNREDKQQAVDQINSFVDTLTKRIDKLETNLATCLDGHVKDAQDRLKDAEDRGFMKGRIDELSKQLNLNTEQTASAKDTAIVANTKADAAMDASQTALVNLPPPVSPEQQGK